MSKTAIEQAYEISPQPDWEIMAYLAEGLNGPQFAAFCAGAAAALHVAPAVIHAALIAEK